MTPICGTELMLCGSGIAGVECVAMVVHVGTLAHSQIICLLCVDKRSGDTFCKRSGLLCSISAGMFTNSSGGCYSLILLKASKLLKQNSHWSCREFFMPSTCSTMPVNVEHFRIPWEETIILTREMPFPCCNLSKTYVWLCYTKYCRGNVNGELFSICVV